MLAIYFVLFQLLFFFGYYKLECRVPEGGIQVVSKGCLVLKAMYLLWIPSGTNTGWKGWVKPTGPEQKELISGPEHFVTLWAFSNKVSNYFQFAVQLNCHINAKVWSAASSKIDLFMYDRFNKEWKWTPIRIYIEVAWTLQIKSCTVIRFLICLSYTVSHFHCSKITFWIE